MAWRITEGRATTGKTRIPVRKPTSSTAERLVGSTIASVSAPAVRPIGTTSCFCAMAGGTSLRISGGMPPSGNTTNGMR